MLDENYKRIIEVLEEVERFSANVIYDFSESENHQEKPVLE